MRSGLPVDRRAVPGWAKPTRGEQQALRFITAGAATAILDMTLLYLLTELVHLYYLVSVAIAFLAASAASYAVSANWIFWRGRHREQVEALLFLVTSAVGLLLNEVVVYVLVEFAVVWYLTAKIVAIAVAALWNFWCRRRLVFAS